MSVIHLFQNFQGLYIAGEYRVSRTKYEWLAVLPFSTIVVLSCIRSDPVTCVTHEEIGPNSWNVFLVCLLVGAMSSVLTKSSAFDQTRFLINVKI